MMIQSKCFFIKDSQINQRPSFLHLIISKIQSPFRMKSLGIGVFLENFKEFL
eukprot:UN26947